LVKNPTGFNRALFALLGNHDAPKQEVLIAINDNDADGRDISWLWDVDFEMLALHPEKFSRFLCSGQRAEDMALRLKYAGVPVWMVDVEKDYRRAVDKVLNGKGESVGILATYTALWPVEKVLSRQAERVMDYDDYSLSSVS
jgi:UDP-N-acetylmuramyl tripeptide synthase